MMMREQEKITGFLKFISWVNYIIKRKASVSLESLKVIQ